MYHDEATPAHRRDEYYQIYIQLAEAVRSTLGMIRSLLHEMERVANDTGQDHHTTPVMLTYDFMDAIDGFCLLAERGSSRNCDLLLRNAYEIELAFMYLSKDQSEYPRRCLAYEYFHLDYDLKVAERVDTTTDTGKKLQAELADDPHACTLDLRAKYGAILDQEINSLKSNLGSDRYREVRQEIDRMKTVSQKVKGWHSLWGGPTDVRQLARATSGLSLYEALYRPWSGVTHGGRAIRRIRGRELDGRAQLTPIRSPDGLPGKCRHALNLGNMFALHMCDIFVPHLRGDLRTHYINHIMPARKRIDSINIGN